MKTKNISRRSFSILLLATLFAAVSVLSGCQEVFTSSLLEGLQRDPSSLPPEQQISYAESALASGDTSAMADIYDDIVDLAADDPELYLLAADLAMGASGITDVIGDALADPTTFDYTTDLAGVNLTMLANVADNVLLAESNGISGITEEQYVAAAGAEVLQFLEGGGDLSTVDWTDSTTASASGTEILNAYNFLVSAGQDPASFSTNFTG